MNVLSEIKGLSEKYFEDIRKYRRHLHANPELSFKEFETSKFIASILNNNGISFSDGIAETGILAEIKGRNPDSKLIALRADMDALPIQEANQISYASQNEGVMHACGHDVHSSSLIGTALILNDLKEHWEGTIQFIFQPGEEKLPGGASLMLKGGIFEKASPSKIIGQHVYPELEVGKVGFKGGKYMASTDEIYLKVIGKGGHGALPHRNIDPVLISSHIIVGLQQLISRKARPDIPSVLSFGKIIGLGATNVIPDHVTLEGTFRTVNENWRDEAHKLISDIAQGIASSMGGKCELEIKKGYPCLINNEKLTAQNIEAAKHYLGEENVEELSIRMTAEDFSFFAQEVPGCFYRLGTANSSEGINAPVHNARFNIDEEALKIGPGLMAWLAIQ
ncbi:MAG: M20 family metallopeptidase [Bacteroidota bacterium]